MTLALLLYSETCVVVAADKQQTMTGPSGNYTETVDKIVSLPDGSVVVAAGPAGGIDLFKGALASGGGEWGLSRGLNERFRQAFSKEEAEKNEMQFLYVWPPDQAGFRFARLASPNFINSAGSGFSTIGSGCQSTYFLKSFFDKFGRKATAEQLVGLACFCVSQTSKQDPLVKGLDVIVIHEDGRIENVSESRLKAEVTKAQKTAAKILKLIS